MRHGIAGEFAIAQLHGVDLNIDTEAVVHLIRQPPPAPGLRIPVARIFQACHLQRARGGLAAVAIDDVRRALAQVLMIRCVKVEIIHEFKRVFPRV